MSKLRFVWVSLAAISLSGWCARPAAAGEGPDSQTPLLKLSAPAFTVQGTFEQILARIAVEMRPFGVFGFVPDSAHGEAQLLVSEGEVVGDLLNRLCAREGRYRVSATKYRRVVNVLPIHPPDDVNRLLDLRLPRVDISTDTWPENWYMYLPDYCPEVRVFLENYYHARPHPPAPGGSPGANMETDRGPPHLDLHLKNVTVQEVLNALASKYNDWAAAENAPPPGREAPPVTYPAFALGWELRLPDTTGVQLNGWLHSVFTTFPESTHE